MDKPVTDLELLARWGGGDRDAGGDLLGRYVDPLSRFFQNKVGQGQEDLVQQTLLACVEGRERFRGDASFRTFVFQTARFQLYAHARRRSRRREVTTSSADDPCTLSTPACVLAHKQEQRSLLEALHRMPLHYQVVLELNLWEDLSGREMAEILGLPEPTLRSRLRLAAEQLRRRMRETSSTAHGFAEPADFDEWARRVRTTMSRDAGSAE